MVLYKCNLCDNKIKKFYQSKDMQAGFLSCQCGGVLERQVTDFGTTSLEIVDNGNMAKRVELRKDAAFKFKEKGDIYAKTMDTRDSVLGVKPDDEK